MINQPFLICLFGWLIVLFLLWLIRFILAPRRSFTDFFVGDTGTYSLSRLQAVLWAVIIIGYQISALIAVGVKTNWHFSPFRLVFSKEVIWLLGLSLASYVTVKGITVSQIKSGDVTPRKFSEKRKLSDLVMSDEGLDFSRFQMLIWTIFSILVFFSSYYYYVDQILRTTAIDRLSDFFPQFDDTRSILPSIDMSFIVLMGLSQGTYIGRKLVPDNRVAEFTQEYIQDIETREYGLNFQESELRLMILRPDISPEKKFELQGKLKDILDKKNNLLTEKNAANESLKAQ